MGIGGELFHVRPGQLRERSFEEKVRSHHQHPTIRDDVIAHGEFRPHALVEGRVFEEFETSELRPHGGEAREDVDRQLIAPVAGCTVVGLGPVRAIVGLGPVRKP